jgi:hypothetical protein
MPWNEADRAKYDVIRARYSRDLSDWQEAPRATRSDQIKQRVQYLARAGGLASSSLGSRKQRDNQCEFLVSLELRSVHNMRIAPVLRRNICGFGLATIRHGSSAHYESGVQESHLWPCARRQLHPLQRGMGSNIGSACHSGRVTALSCSACISFARKRANALPPPGSAPRPISRRGKIQRPPAARPGCR